MSRMQAWQWWKQRWRRLERSTPVRLAKRRARQLLGRELRHFVQVRVPKESYGGWTVSPAGLRAGSVVYSFGVGRDVAFELELIARYGVEVHAFDPTPEAIAWVESQRLPASFHFHAYGVASHDGSAYFHPPVEATNSYTMLARPATAHAAVAGAVHRLPTILQMLGHTRLDVLKLDIEGMEYPVIEEMLETSLDARQLLVEFHHRWPSVGRAQTQRAVEQLADRGYRIFAISAPGWEYSFIRIPSRGQ